MINAVDTNTGEVTELPREVVLKSKSEIKTSETVTKIYSALIKAEEDMPSLAADAEFVWVMNNKRYVSSDSLLAQTKKVLRANWIYTLFSVKKYILDITSSKAKYAADVVLRATEAKSWEWVEVSVPGAKSDKKEITLHSVITLAKKVAMKCLIHVETNDDDPEQEDVSQVAETKAKKKAGVLIEAVAKPVKKPVEKKVTGMVDVPKAVIEKGKKKVAENKKKEDKIKKEKPAVVVAEEVFEAKVDSEYKIPEELKSEEAGFLTKVNYLKWKVKSNPEEIEKFCDLIDKSDDKLLVVNKDKVKEELLKLVG